VYQSIEHDKSEETTPKPGLETPWIWSSVLAGLSLIVIIGWLYSTTLSDRMGQSDPISPEPDARMTYLRALSETDPALRRARLTDFLSQYPENPRDRAVRAQLSVLDGAADRDWQATLTTAYDPRVDKDTRRAAVVAYQDEWGQYLGARDEEIEKLLADIERMPTGDELPDRTLPRDEAAYIGIPNDRLAGDRFGVEPRVIFRSSRDERLSQRGSQRDLSGDIIGPRVTREETPRYPRRAERRGVDAVVTLSLTVDATGRVSMVELIDVEADRYADDFIKEAERAALRTRFAPRTIGGIPIEAVGIQKRYRFQLD
jgi:TonB family protein